MKNSQHVTFHLTNTNLGECMKKNLLVFLSLFTVNAMAMSNVECVQAQLDRLDRTKIVRELTEVHIRAINTDFYSPTVKFEGRNKVTIEAAFNPSNGICVTASPTFIDYEASRQND